MCLYHFIIQGVCCHHVHDSDESSDDTSSSTSNSLTQLEDLDRPHDKLTVTVTCSSHSDNGRTLFMSIAGNIMRKEDHCASSNASTQTISNDDLHNAILAQWNLDVLETLNAEEIQHWLDNTPAVIITETLPFDNKELVVDTIKPVRVLNGGRAALEFTHSKVSDLNLQVYLPQSPSDVEGSQGAGKLFPSSQLVKPEVSQHKRIPY